MSIDYASEKLTAAASTLATSPDTIQKRLYYAWMACHTLTNPSFHDNFPTPQIARRFMTWSHSLTYQEAQGDEGTLEATTSRLSDEEARKAADELWALYVEVEELYTIAVYERESSYRSR